MIIGGGLMIAFGIGNGGVAIGLSNLWAHGGFMPNGLNGVVAALPIVMFAYLGVEMLGLTAGEARNPEVADEGRELGVLARADFYIGALFVIMSLYPWDQIGTGQPVRDDVLAARHPGGGRHHQLRRADRGAVVVQQRPVQHRADALQPRAAGPAPSKLGRSIAMACRCTA